MGRGHRLRTSVLTGPLRLPFAYRPSHSTAFLDKGSVHRRRAQLLGREQGKGMAYPTSSFPTTGASTTQGRRLAQEESGARGCWLVARAAAKLASVTTQGPHVIYYLRVPRALNALSQLEAQKACQVLLLPAF